MHRVLCVLLLVPGLAAMQGRAKAQRASASAGTSEPILVELFTSEGCSSCPPADALLRHISGKLMASGRPIVTISEHVTYWNRTGWMDPFSSDVATQRQADYADRLHVDSGVYTPQMVVDGVTQFVGSDARALDSALKNADRITTDVTIRIGAVMRDKGSADVQFAMSGDVKRAKRIDVYAFVTDDEDQVHVRGGENADRVLTHVTVARSVAHVKVRDGVLTGTIRVRMPSGAPVGGKTGRHLILVAQQDGVGPVLAVAERPL